MREGQGPLGWATDDLVKLDGLAPGLIGRVLTTSSMRRHAIMLVLAERRGDCCMGGGGDDDTELVLASILRRARAREIVEHAFGAAPDGLLGALERLGDDPAPSPWAYGRLHTLFLRPECRSKAEALQRVGGQITEPMLRVMEVLDPRWVHTETLRRIESTGAARAFNDAMSFVQSVCSKATDEVVAGAIARLQPTSTLASLIQRFVRRADRFPPHPLSAGEDLRPLTSVPDHLAAGRAYRNCLAKKVAEVLVGRVAFAEFAGQAILELRPLSGGSGWVLLQVHVARNASVPRTLADAAEAACAKVGIAHIDSDVGADRLKGYRRITYPNPWMDWAA